MSLEHRNLTYSEQSIGPFSPVLTKKGRGFHSINQIDIFVKGVMQATDVGIF